MDTVKATAFADAFDALLLAASVELDVVAVRQALKAYIRAAEHRHTEVLAALDLSIPRDAETASARALLGI